MGVAIPQLAPASEDRVSGAQVVDGSLRFDGTSQYLTRSFGSGNRRTWTWAAWVKRYKFGAANYGLFSYYPGSGNGGFIRFSDDDSGDTLRFYSDTNTRSIVSKEKFRDTGWYHIVIAVDTTQGTDTDRVKRYVNGVWQTTNASNTWPSSSEELLFNQSGNHYLGRVQASAYGPVAMSQVHFIDGQALGPEYFGYTDALTGTWRPKKFQTTTRPNNGTTWSSSLSATDPIANASNAFDNSISTYADRASGSSDPNDYTFTPPSTIKAYSSVRMYAYAASGHSSNHFKITYNGETTLTKTAADLGLGTPGALAWFDLTSYLTFPIDISSFEYRSISGGGQLAAFEIDGVLLIDGLNDTKGFGTNGFHLPFDGSAPIGQDQSGRGNNWTPVNFGGSMELPKATGALPILNTDGGGKTARPGVFGSEVGAYYTVTTANGSVYQFDITSGDNPSLSFIRGATYKFDYSSFTGHPVLFSSTNPDSSTTAYTDGTSIANNVISFTVPHDAPDTLYYYCQNHPTSMNGSISVTTDTKKADPYAWKNVLALPLVGNQNDISASIRGSGSNKTIAKEETPGPSSTQSNFYGTSFYFDGDRDHIYSTAGNDSDFVLNGVDWTLECWVYPTDVSGTRVIMENTSSGTGGWSIQINSGEIEVQLSSLFDATPSNAIVANKWTHIAVVRSGSTTTLYLDGINRGTTSTDAGTTSNASLWVGSRSGGSYSYIGYMSDIRVYKGVAKYTSNFIPASTDPDILPDTPSGVAGGSALTKVTDGAVSFDGTNDKLTITAHSDLDLSSGDFTVEGFVYPLRSQEQGFVNNWNTLSTGQFQVQMSSSGFLQASWAPYSTSVYAVTGTTPIRLNAWSHFAYTRNGNTFELFLDGISQGTQTSSNNASVNSDFILGENSDGARDLQGYLSNVRIIKGTALYTSNFTPPTASLTATETTKLLCCKSNSSATAFDVSPGSITANGNAAATNFNPFTTDINAVRGQESGYATFNPLDNGGLTLSNGNLDATRSTTSWVNCRHTIGMSSRKWYWEITVTSRSTNDGIMPGILNAAGSLSTTVGANSGGYAYNFSSAQKYNNNSASSYGVIVNTGDVVGIAFDADNGSLTFYVNGQSQGVAFTGIPDGTYFPATSLTGSSDPSAPIVSINHGQRPFKFPPPEGFQPLNAANVRPSTVIARPDQYVGVTTYSGNNTGQTINLGFQPDFVWIKPRSAINHALFDSVRGATKRLISNLTNTEDTVSAVTAFNRDGFTLGGDYNSSGTNYVAWSWKAGGNSNTFNIDGRGYASASDIGMNVGGQNSNSYDQSQTWSSNLSVNTGTISNATQAFNGDLTNGADSSASTGSDDRTMTATLGLTLNNEYVYVYPNHTYSGYYATIDGVAQSIQYFTTPNGFKQMGPFTGTLTSVTVTNGTETSSRPAGIRAIRVGNKILVDTAITPPNAPSLAATGASIGTKQGFSIVTYTGNNSSYQSIPHRLGSVPAFYVCKARTSSGFTDSWNVYHQSIGFDAYIKLQEYDQATTGSSIWNNTPPTDNLFYVSTGSNANENGVNYVAYLWAEIPGLQKFGSYEGNGNANGPFIELGFRPAVVLLKTVDTAANWMLYDNQRGKYNPNNYVLGPNVSDGGQTYDGYGNAYPIDFLSNGFKVRTDVTNSNASSTIIYAAWAEAPSFNLYGAQSNAR